MEERIINVGADWIKTLVFTATKAPIDLQWGKCCGHDSAFILIESSSNFADNKYRCKFSDRVDWVRSDYSLRSYSPLVHNNLFKVDCETSSTTLDASFLMVSIATRV